MRYQSRDHTDPLRLDGVEAPGRQEQVARHSQADMGGEHGGVGSVGDAAQKLRHPEGGAVARHGDVGQHGDEEAAGLADPIDCRHDRRPAVPDRQERQDVVPDVGRGLVAGIRAPAEVAARSKDIPRPRDDQCSQVGICVDDAHGSLNAEVHGRREGVPGVWPVDHTPRDHALAFEAQACRAEFL